MKAKAAVIVAVLLLIMVVSISALIPKKSDSLQPAKKTNKIDLSKYSLKPTIDVQPKMKDIWLGICFETDYGKDYDHAGTTTYLPPANDWCRTQVSGMLEQCRDFRIGSCLQYLPDECRIASIPDRCLDGTVLIEAYCSWRGASTTHHRCRNGCYNGACY